MKINVLERLERMAHEMRDDECWDTDYQSTNRSGHVRIRGEDYDQVFIHRLAWEAHNAEPIPEDKIIMHTCDNPRCWNPEHLRLGSLSDNTRDMFAKGREGVSRDTTTGRWV